MCLTKTGSRLRIIGSHGTALHGAIRPLM